MLEKTLESPLDCKEIKPVHPKGNQPWIFTGRTDAKAETPILWLHDAKSWFIRKDPDAGKDWNQEEKGMTENEMIGWHHQWTWVWVKSGSWWWTGRPGVLQFMGSQKVRQEQLNWTELHVLLLPHSSWVFYFCFYFFSLDFSFRSFSAFSGPVSLDCDLHKCFSNGIGFSLCHLLRAVNFAYKNVLV